MTKWELCWNCFDSGSFTVLWDALVLSQRRLRTQSRRLKRGTAECDLRLRCIIYQIWGDTLFWNPQKIASIFPPNFLNGHQVTKKDEFASNHAVATCERKKSRPDSQTHTTNRCTTVPHACGVWVDLNLHVSGLLKASLLETDIGPILTLNMKIRISFWLQMIPCGSLISKSYKKTII